MSGDIPAAVERYIVALRAASQVIPAAEREDFVFDIQSHVLDRIAAERTPDAGRIDEILAAVGDPADLARLFATDAILRRASRSISPWTLLRATLRWAMKGLAGLVAFVITIGGFGAAAVCYAVVALKPLLPDNIGLWHGPAHRLTLGYWDGNVFQSETYGLSFGPPGQFVIGSLGPVDGAVRELAGPWIYLIGLVGGAVFLIATIMFSRWMIRRFGLRRYSGTNASTSPSYLVNRMGKVRPA